MPIGDKERLSKLPSLVAKKLTVLGEGEKVAAADIQLSSVGKKKQFSSIKPNFMDSHATNSQFFALLHEHL